MTTRNNIGQFKRKPKGVLALIAIMVVVGVILYNAGDNEEATVEPVADIYNQEATLDPKVVEYMNSEQFKLETELRGRTGYLNQKKAETTEEYKRIEAERKAVYDSDIKDIEIELEDIRKQEIELGKKPTGLKE